MPRPNFYILVNLYQIWNLFISIPVCYQLIGSVLKKNKNLTSCVYKGQRVIFWNEPTYSLQLAAGKDLFQKVQIFSKLAKPPNLQ